LAAQSAAGSTWDVVGNATYAARGKHVVTVIANDSGGNVAVTNHTTIAALSFDGQYAIQTGNSLTLGSITQVGNLLILSAPTLGSAGVTTATITGPGQLLVGGTDKGGFVNNTIDFGMGVPAFPPSGQFVFQFWTKLDLPSDFTTATGAATHVITSGNSLILVNEFGVPGAASWINATQLSAFGMTATVGNGKLTWSNGTVWYENVSLGGSLNGSGTTNISARPSQMTVVDYTNLKGASVHVIENGTTDVIFVDSLGRMSLGSFFNTLQATADTYQGDVATFIVGSEIVWQDGSVWIKSTAPSNQIVVTDYTNPNGLATHAITNGTSNLAFADSLGRLSLGVFSSATQATANAYPGDMATFTATTVTWQDGAVWTRTSAPPNTITATDANGNVSHVKLLTNDSVVGLDGPLRGVTGTRQDGKLVWSNGDIWDDFDFNALNSLFEIELGIPRFAFPG